MLKIAQFLINIKNMIELIMIFSILYYFKYIIQSKIITLTLNKDGLTSVRNVHCSYAKFDQKIGQPDPDG